MHISFLLFVFCFVVFGCFLILWDENVIFNSKIESGRTRSSTYCFTYLLRLRDVLSLLCIVLRSFWNQSIDSFVILKCSCFFFDFLIIKSLERHFPRIEFQKNFSANLKRRTIKRMKQRDSLFCSKIKQIHFHLTKLKSIKQKSKKQNKSKYHQN